MEWLEAIKNSIRYMEDHLLTIQSPDEVAENVHISAMYLQKGFQIMTGYTLGEYMRNRKLYLAALELLSGEEKVIDVAYKYGYETPESFSKAFSRYHGFTPKELAANKTAIKQFHPLTVTIVIQGGDKMDFTVEKTASFKVIGFAREFYGETAMQEIPKFWDELYRVYGKKAMRGVEPTNAIEQAFVFHRIGEYGICIDNIGKPGYFKYMIAGKYMGGEVPEGVEVYGIPEQLWAKFKCTGALPDALQGLTKQVWSDWLPGNNEYELDGAISIEWYSASGLPVDPDYQTGLWMPVKRK